MVASQVRRAQEATIIVQSRRPRCHRRYITTQVLCCWVVFTIQDTSYTFWRHISMEAEASRSKNDIYSLNMTINGTIWGQFCPFDEKQIKLVTTAAFYTRSRPHKGTNVQAAKYSCRKNDELVCQQLRFETAVTFLELGEYDAKFRPL